MMCVSMYVCMYVQVYVCLSMYVCIMYSEAYVCMYVYITRPLSLCIYDVIRSVCGHAVRVQALRDAAAESVEPFHDLRVGADSLDKRAEGRPQGARGPHALC